jgi:acetolactate synthase-1/2/3 large subunit
MARTLFDLGVRRLFGFPGGEILDVVAACRTTGIDFVLTRDEATAAFMADAAGQLQRAPGVCVATLGPGALNLALGVANAYLDRSPVIAITAAIAAASQPYATHQNVDLNAVYRPFTKRSITLDGNNTASVVRGAYGLASRMRMGPVHLALPSDVARSHDRVGDEMPASFPNGESNAAASADSIQRIASVIRAASRPVVILGFDLDPIADRPSVQRFVEQLGAPVFTTPKAKGMLSEDHPLYYGVCAGVAADNLVVDFFASSDLLVGIGFDPVESNKLWHHTMKLVSVSPASIAVDAYEPLFECVGDVNTTLRALVEQELGRCDWSEGELAGFRSRFDRALRPSHEPQGGLSPYEVTQRLRQLLPRDAIHVTDVGSVKFVTTQVWQTYEPQTFLLSNGLSSMSYALPGGMAAKLLYPDRVVLSTIGDGGLAMTLGEIETCVRRGINLLTVVYNDSSLSLIRIAQEYRGHDNCGVDFGAVDFAAAARACGAWGVRIETMAELDRAVVEALRLDRPAVLDVVLDPGEYRVHAAPDFPRG